MSEEKTTYNELLNQNNKLKADNKRLRLRPSINSIDTNILEFMNIKGEMANEALNSTNIDDAVLISLKHILRITNIHSASFFNSKVTDRKIEIINHKRLPKRLIPEINNQEYYSNFHSFLFPKEPKIYFSDSMKVENNEIDIVFLKHLKRYHTAFVIPVFQSIENNISLLLLSHKELENDKYIHILYQSIQAQLHSSFTRIVMNDKLIKQTTELEEKIKERTQSFELMNKELLNQIQTHRGKEQEYSEELNLFKSIIIQQKDIVLRINKEGKILYSNPQFMHVKMIHKGEKENLINYFGGGDFPGIDFINWDFERNVQKVNCEIQLFADSMEWFNFNFSPIRNKRGMVTEIQIVARNIHQIKKLEDRLKHQKGMLLSMINSTKKIMFTINIEKKVEFISHKWEKLTGHTTTKTINHHIQDFAVPNELDFITSKIDSLMNNEQKNCSFDCSIKFADKSVHIFETALTSIYSNEGELVYLVGDLSLKENRE